MRLININLQSFDSEPVCCAINYSLLTVSYNAVCLMFVAVSVTAVGPYFSEKKAHTQVMSSDITGAPIKADTTLLYNNGRVTKGRTTIMQTHRAIHM